MRTFDAAAVRQALDWSPLIEALRSMFREGCVMPVRHHHQVAVPDQPDATLLLMPAWLPGRYVGVKLVNVFPGNAEKGLPAVQAGYLLSDGNTGTPLAMLDGNELTARRTAAASALAAGYLARPDATRLLIVGTGALAPKLAAAHAVVRTLSEIRIWGRDGGKAAALARTLSEQGLPAEPAGNLEAAVHGADIVSCATLASQPLICGDWLRPGGHLDLVGGFRPDMREADDVAVRRATVFVDTRGGAMTEAGDIVQPLANGVLSPGEIAADLYDLTAGRHAGRASAEEVTLFRSVGAALEDLAAAMLVYERGSEAADGSSDR